MSTLPAGFIGRPSTLTEPASPAEVKILRKCSYNLTLGLLSLITSPFGLVFPPVAVLMVIAGLYMLVEALRGFSEAKAGTVKKAACPSCGHAVFFSGSEAFPCGNCKQQLMGQGRSLYWLG
jgi:ribosomal protein S27AE